MTWVASAEVPHANATGNWASGFYLAAGCQRLEHKEETLGRRAQGQVWLASWRSGEGCVVSSTQAGSRIKESAETDSH